MTMSNAPALVETLNYPVDERASGKGELLLEWENPVATVALAAKEAGRSLTFS